MSAQNPDLLVDVSEPSLQGRSYVVLRAGENASDVADAHADRTVKTNLPESLDFPFAVDAVIGVGANGRREQAFGFVVQDRGATESAETSEFGYGHHRHDQDEPYSFRQVKRKGYWVLGTGCKDLRSPQSCPRQFL